MSDELRDEIFKALLRGEDNAPKPWHNEEAYWHAIADAVMEVAGPLAEQLRQMGHRMIDADTELTETVDLARWLLAESAWQRDQADAEAVLRQATLKGLTVEEGAAVLELGPPRELVIAWVDAARKMLGDAENYSETRIDFPRESFSMEIKAAGEVERYVVTVQRAGRLTPHEARSRAEAERDADRESRFRWAEEAAEITAQRDAAVTRWAVSRNMRNRLDFLDAQIEQAVGLLDEFAGPEDDPCEFDHHGGCQAHGFLEPADGERCHVARAREFIESARTWAVRPASWMRSATVEAAPTTGIALADRLFGINYGAHVGEVDAPPDGALLARYDIRERGETPRPHVELITLKDTFAGCTDTDPYNCACNDPGLPSCDACSEEIESGQQAYMQSAPGYPWLADDHTDQEYVITWWHAECDQRAERGDQS